MARKVNRNLIALGSAAIVGVYALGYARTQPAANHVAAALATPPTAAPSNIARNAAPVPAATAIARAIASATAPAAAQRPGSGVSATPSYRDGTYSGSGTSRRGDIYADVTIQGGKITSVQITRATTYYPVSRISRLPGQVVDRQSALVDFVSGATDSSRAFRQAVASALSQASVGGSGAAAPAGR
jgi:uncharacterized protein with FMN-binding domain